ncbi:MAG TPA: DUF885 domain-containing protein [Planctomycetota bacterium]
MKRLPFVPLLALAASCGFYRPDPAGREGELPELGGGETASFRSLADAALEALYSAFPERATADGVHDHDNRLGDWSRAGVDARAASLRRHLRRLEALALDVLPEASYYDALQLISRFRAELFDLETVRSWERDPGHYRRVISDALYPLAALGFAPVERRRGLAEGRLGDVPGLLAAARANLANPPRIFTEIAIEDFGGLLAFVRDGLPQAFGDPKNGEFAEARKDAVEALTAFLAWMKAELLPKSAGAFALGAEAYRTKLLHEEMIETPLDVLLDRGYALLRRTREEMKAAAGARAPEDVLKEAAKDHPPAEKLLDETKALLAELKRWASTVATLPEEDDVRVIETPAFRRSTSFASMQTPGPFETAAKEAYYAVTLPDPGWTEDRKAQHLSFFSRPSLALISVHEVWPGHYAQNLLARHAPTRVRKALGSAAFSEGWAHYTEQLYAESVPAVRLIQLKMALLRVCRYVAALEMHTRGMSVEKATEFFMTEGLLPAAAAEREARRGAVDPLYLVYTLGKAEILRLRDDWRNATGGSLKDFHDALLRAGHPPLKIARMILLEGRRGP